VVPVGDESRQLAAGDLELTRCVRPHLPELQSARLATAAVVGEHEDALVVELAILVHVSAKRRSSAHERLRGQPTTSGAGNEAPP
jgi:hypothetical protein